MLATVTYPYRDRETFEVHVPGEQVELSTGRFAELSAGGFVDAAPEAARGPEAADEAAPCDAEATAADDGGEPDTDGRPSGDEPAAAPAAGPTKEQIRAQIEAKGGFAPKKATKEQLAGILESL